MLGHFQQFQVVDFKNAFWTKIEITITIVMVILVAAYRYYWNNDHYWNNYFISGCNNRSLISSSSSWSRNRALSFKHLNQIQNLLFLLSLIKFRKFRCSENYCRRLYATYCHYFVLCRILLCASWLNGVFRYKLCKSSSFKANLTTTPPAPEDCAFVGRDYDQVIISCSCLESRENGVTEVIVLSMVIHSP